MIRVTQRSSDGLGWSWPHAEQHPSSHGQCRGDHSVLHTLRSQAIQGCWELGLEEAQRLSSSKKVPLGERPHGADTSRTLFLVSLPATLKAEIIVSLCNEDTEIQKDEVTCSESKADLTAFAFPPSCLDRSKMPKGLLILPGLRQHASFLYHSVFSGASRAFDDTFHTFPPPSASLGVSGSHLLPTFPNEGP